MMQKFSTCQEFKPHIRHKILKKFLELPKHVLPTQSYPYADGRSFDGKSMLGLEYIEGAPTAYIGNQLIPKLLTLDDETLNWPINE